MLKKSAQGKRSKKAWIRSIMTLLIIISLTWYAKQGQNNPFRDLRVIKIINLHGYTSLVSYTKKRDLIKQQVILPLKKQNLQGPIKKGTLKDLTLINSLNHIEINTNDSSIKEILNLKEISALEKKKGSIKGISFSDPVDIEGLIFSKIYSEKNDSSIALSIMAEDISVISINDPDLLISDSSAQELKEKFMVAIVTGGTEEEAKKIRNVLRPEYLLALRDSNKGSTIENIVFLSQADSLKISKDIKGMIRLKDLGN